MNLQTVQTDLDSVEKFIDTVQFPFSVGNFDDPQFLSDLTYCLSSKHNLLPELLNVIPKEYVFNFLYVFAGQKMAIPDSHILYNTARDINIYYRLRANNSIQEINNIASLYKMTNQTVLYAYNKIKDQLES